jgi:hypothetical protein
VFYQFNLSGSVTAIHCPDLRNGLMAFIHNQQIIIGEIVHQTVGAFAGLSGTQVSRIILNSGAVPDLLHHLDIKKSTLFQSFGFEEFFFLFQNFNPPVKLITNLFDGFLKPPL